MIVLGLTLKIHYGVSFECHTIQLEYDRFFKARTLSVWDATFKLVCLVISLISVHR